MEKYSFLMSVYYKEKPEYLKLSIESMINQTVKPDEIVIVKDGKLTPELDEVISKYVNDNKSIFTIISLEKNMGLGPALNEGLKVARNELIARMDSDDICKLDRCEKQLKIFKTDASLSVVGTNITEFIDNEENVISRRSVPEKNEDIKRYLKKRCPLNHVTVMFKKSKIIDAGGYIEWHYNEDYYLWIRLYEHANNFYNIQEDLVNVRVGKEMYKRRGGIKYFISEKNIQDYMLNKNIIDFFTYIANVSKRLILQVLLPNNIRGWIFKKFARTKCN